MEELVPDVFNYQVHSYYILTYLFINGQALIL